MHTDLITISREYGAGASELAVLLGTRLGWRVLDAEIPHTVAERLRIPADSLEEWDEHAPRFLESVGNSFMLGSPDLLIDPSFVGRPQPRDVAAATQSFLREAAAASPLIVVGHGAQVIFVDRPNTLHLRLVAPIAARIPRIIARRGCTPKEAEGIAKYVDGDRTKYLKDFLGRDLHDPCLYALQINTGMIAMSDVVEIVMKLV